MLLVTLGLQLFFPLSQSYIAFVGLFLLISYLFLQLLLRKQFSKELDRIMPKGLSIVRKSIVPATYWRWKGVLETNDKFYLFRKKEAKMFIEEIEKKTIPLSMTSSKIDIYKEYSRHLMVKATDDELILHNLIYSPSTYYLRAKFSENENIKIEMTLPNLKYDDY